MGARQTLLLETLLGQTRLAVVEDGELRELYCDRPNGENLTGNIYLGRAESVLPGMNAAFVDIGIGKNAFLPAGELVGGGRIEERVRPGQELLLQVTRAATGDKGPRVSTRITLAGRFLALLPTEEGIGISRRIAADAERARLQEVLSGALSGTGMGAIARTAAEGASEVQIAAEVASLTALWRELSERAAHAIAPKRLYSDTALALHAVRDLLNEDTEALWTDSPGAFGLLQGYAGALTPQWQDRIRFHRGEQPLFDLYRIDDQLDKALRKRVWLKSGGFLFVEETEALTVIDVNTGKFTGKKDLEETVFRLNCEAAAEVMRQLRLRDIGGIVIVDFIDMAAQARCEALLALLRELAAQDRNRTAVVGLTSLGLVEITRRRARQPLRSVLFHACEACGGSGLEPSHETTARRALRDVWRRRRSGAEGPLLIEAQEAVVGWLKTIGAPAGGDVYAAPADDLAPGETRVTPAEPGKLPEGAQPLKRG